MQQHHHHQQLQPLQHPPPSRLQEPAQQRQRRRRPGRPTAAAARRLPLPLPLLLLAGVFAAVLLSGSGGGGSGGASWPRSVLAAAGKQQQQQQQPPRDALGPFDGEVVTLTDANFDRLTRGGGAWMVDVFAPWCAHCQQLEPAWHALAMELAPHGVRVAKVDGTRNRALMRRFGVTGFPSIYLLRGGRAWQYQSARGVHEMRDFALSGYKRASALPYHKAPNSLAGRVIGALHSLPVLAQRGYAYLKNQRGLSDAAIVAGALLVPLALGAGAICVLDALCTRAPHRFGGDGGGGGLEPLEPVAAGAVAPGHAHFE